MLGADDSCWKNASLEGIYVPFLGSVLCFAQGYVVRNVRAMELDAEGLRGRCQEMSALSAAASNTYGSLVMIYQTTYLSLSIDFGALLLYITIKFRNHRY